MLYIGWVGLGMGLVSRVFIPWLNERRLNPDEAQWSWRFVWPQLISIAIVALALPLVVPNLETVGQLPLVPAYLAGWGAADVGRLVDKAVTKN